MNIKEQKAKEYAEKAYPYTESMRFQCETHYEAGWDESLKNQWVSTEERLPQLYEKVLVMIEYEGEIQIHDYTYMGIDLVYGISKIIAWMPVPSFDEILQANKDVLKRLKDM